MNKKIKCGIHCLDEDKGGIRAGSLCSVIWRADSMGENIGFKLCSISEEDRSSYYIANLRRPDYIRARVKDIKGYTNRMTPENESDASLEYELNIEKFYDSDNLNEVTTKIASKLDNHDNIVLDDARIVRDIGEIRKLKKVTRENKTVTYLNLPYLSKEDFDEFERKLLQISDFIIELRSEFEGGGGDGRNIMRIKKTRESEFPGSFEVRNPVLFRQDSSEPL